MNTKTSIQTFNWKAMRDACLASGIKSFCVDFAGCGDSGSFDDPTIVGKFDKSTTVTLLDDKGRETTKIIADAIAQIVDDYVSGTSCDWWNGEGGRGQLTYNVERDVLNCVINEFVIHEEEVFCFEGSPSEAGA